MKFTYEDEDQDVVTIDTQDDFDEAISCFHAQGCPVTINFETKNLEEEKKEIGLSKCLLSTINREDSGIPMSESMIHEDLELAHHIKEVVDDKGEKILKNLFDSQARSSINDEEKLENPQEEIAQPKAEEEEIKPEVELSKKSSEFEDPSLGKKESYGMYCDSYLELIDEIKNEMQRIGVDMDEENQKSQNKEPVEEYFDFSKSNHEEEKVQLIEEPKKEVHEINQFMPNEKVEENKVEKIEPLIDFGDSEPKEEEPLKILEEQKEPQKEVELLKFEDNKADIEQAPLFVPEPVKIPQPEEAPEERSSFVAEKAYKHELKILKELEEENYQYNKHNNIELNYKKEFMVGSKVSCHFCNCEQITGVRYLCIECDNFNICSVCESIVTHAHPLLKNKIK